MRTLIKPRVVLQLAKSVIGYPVGSCRFEPTCSRYVGEAFRKLPPDRALLVSLYRILRCNPFFRGGYDPVPAKGRTK